MTDAPDYDAIEAQIAEWTDPDSRTPLSTIAMVAVNNVPALIARCRELEAKVAGIREDVGPDRDGWYEVHRSYIHDLLDGVEP